VESPVDGRASGVVAWSRRWRDGPVEYWRGVAGGWTGQWSSGLESLVVGTGQLESLVEGRASGVLALPVLTRSRWWRDWLEYWPGVAGCRDGPVESPLEGRDSGVVTWSRRWRDGTVEYWRGVAGGGTGQWSSGVESPFERRDWSTGLASTDEESLVKRLASILAWSRWWRSRRADQT